MTLDHDQVEIAVRCYHHVVYFARHSEESQIILWIQISDQASGSYRKLTEAHGVSSSFGTFSHGGANNLGLVTFLHLGLFHDDQALNTFVLLDAGNSLLYFTL